MQRDLLDVRDVVAAYLALLDPAVPAGTYNVARGGPCRSAMCWRCCSRAATVEIRVVPDPARLRSVDTPLLCGDARRLRAATGWKPTRELAATLADLLEAARESVIGDTSPR